MNIGFRPRLRARPSLYDLIAYRSIEGLLEQHSPSQIEDLPPLPISTASSPVSPPSDLVSVQYREPETQPATMAPKKSAKPAGDVEAEEQYGELQEASTQKHPAN
jgi:V-type H+-transporting ATPase subunit A